MIPAHMIPGWLTTQEIRVLHQIGCSYLDHESTVLEIGSFLGRSTAAWADSGARVIAVDPWAGRLNEWTRLHHCMDGNLTIVDWDQCCREGFDRMMGQRPNVYPVQSMSTNYVWEGEDPPTVIFIDGDHSFVGLAHDLDAAYHRWSLGAYEDPHLSAPLIVGHDFDNPHLPQVRHAVEGFAETYNFNLVHLPNTSLFLLEHRAAEGTIDALDLGHLPRY